MIILLHPRTGKPKNRRFPLAILSIAAMLEGRDGRPAEDYAIVDGNLDPAPGNTLAQLASRGKIELLAVSVMPGPQMVSAMELCREFRKRFPRVPIVWGGYFPSLYTDAALNAGYVDYCVRGQGEETFPELLEALRGHRTLKNVRGLSFTDAFGLHVHNAMRPLRSPNDFPWLPYHRLPVRKIFAANASSDAAQPSIRPASAALIDVSSAALCPSSMAARKPKRPNAQPPS